jgi:hypothetical protein
MSEFPSFSSSYGHLEICELLISHGACVNANDLWQFSPIHEASSKGTNTNDFTTASLDSPDDDLG